jgi:molecular chaperone GrpE
MTHDTLNTAAGAAPEAGDAPAGEAGRATAPVAAPEAPGAADPAPETAAATADELLARLEAEATELRDRLLRQAAETENVRRRLEREKADASAYAIASFARDLLGVADNLARALEAAPAELREGAGAALVEGVEATRRELMRVLERHGVAPIAAVGQPLDPNRHQAMLEVETAEHAPGTIVAEFQAGYTIRDRLLRPALVSVARAPAEAGVTE